MLQPLPRKREEIEHEIEALEDFIRTEGWGVMSTRIMDEWMNAGYFARMQTAMASSNPAVDVKVVHQTAINIQALAEWPAKRIQKLKDDLRKVA